MTNRISRLAPSPTGALHLGNARTFLINWAIARASGWRLLMRIEDIDGPRTKPGAAEGALDLLAWLGMDFDGPARVQSADLSPYREAMGRLAEMGLAYRCSLTRREIEAAASAPHGTEHEMRYPPELRPQLQRGVDDSRIVTAQAFDDEQTNYRLLVPDETIRIDDVIAGTVEHNPFREVGDFVIWTKRAMPAYQLAVVVDDARQEVTDVIRGDDLLPSAARQVLLYRALGLQPPWWWHLPLVLGPDGRRLAKRHGDTRIERYRAAGVRPERVIGLLARWSGIGEAEAAPEEMTAEEFRGRFDCHTLPRQPTVFTGEDHRWLLE